MVQRFPAIILSVSQCLLLSAIFLTPLVLRLYYKRFYFILYLFHIISLRQFLVVCSIYSDSFVSTLLPSLLPGSYFFYLVLRKHLPVSHEFHGQSGQRNLIQIYNFCCQLMPLACAHWFSIFSANLPKDLCSELVVSALILLLG